MEDHDAQISAFLKHRCATCRKEFKNLNHLRRHEIRLPPHFDANIVLEALPESECFTRSSRTFADDPATLCDVTSKPAQK
ncbi:hypothetical protein SNOG_07270 [Parastagonospora nodorum SN15]|uniref:C2H2-type domain-containing protein n=1 Tax=Phaeosphaeria nodorum (strain SN15 / ATCC MYA-4574 / FGSC 10173) TaxID=321614 RepID=Q0ULU4_PHANO|nr:hypothetical protein SNOG_07270 [Parastagonospora nodorum SN15]EAT85921.1 hypothetical protein SNOG_07270 [Parastagonospora nodorum SN15]